MSKCECGCGCDRDDSYYQEYPDEDCCRQHQLEKRIKELTGLMLEYVAAAIDKDNYVLDGKDVPLRVHNRKSHAFSAMVDALQEKEDD